jgi:putative transposase
MLNFKGMRFPIDVILVCIRWYAAYPLSYRHLKEMMQKRGVSVDHSSINRWAIRFLPLIEKMARKHERPVGGNWRMDETYIKVKGVWKYLYRAVDKHGKTVDFLLTAKRDMAAAKRFFDKAMGLNGHPDKVAMDKSGANKTNENSLPYNFIGTAHQCSYTRKSGVSGYYGDRNVNTLSSGYAANSERLLHAGRFQLL